MKLSHLQECCVSPPVDYCSCGLAVGDLSDASSSIYEHPHACDPRANHLAQYVSYVLATPSLLLDPTS